MGEKKTNTKKVRRLRLPLLMRISILFLIAFFCAGAILMVLSASFREKRVWVHMSRGAYVKFFFHDLVSRSLHGAVCSFYEKHDFPAVRE